MTQSQRFDARNINGIMEGQCHTDTGNGVLDSQQFVGYCGRRETQDISQYKDE